MFQCGVGVFGEEVVEYGRLGVFLVGGLDFLVLVEFGVGSDVGLCLIEEAAGLGEVGLGALGLVVVVEEDGLLA